MARKWKSQKSRLLFRLKTSKYQKKRHGWNYTKKTGFVADDVWSITPIGEDIQVELKSGQIYRKPLRKMNLKELDEAIKFLEIKGVQVGYAKNGNKTNKKQNRADAVKKKKQISDITILDITNLRDGLQEIIRGMAFKSQTVEEFNTAANKALLYAYMGLNKLVEKAEADAKA